MAQDAGNLIPHSADMFLRNLPTQSRNRPSNYKTSPLVNTTGGLQFLAEHQPEATSLDQVYGLDHESGILGRDQSRSANPFGLGTGGVSMESRMERKNKCDGSNASSTLQSRTYKSIQEQLFDNLQNLVARSYLGLMASLLGARTIWTLLAAPGLATRNKGR